MKKINRKTAGFALVLSVQLFLVVSIGLADINTRMATFDASKARAPVYQTGVTYTALIRDPTPDAVYSYCVDNWDYAEELLDYFQEAKKPFDTQYILVIVAMPDGTFICETLDTELKELQPGYREDVEDRLIVTEEFLAMAIQFGDTHSMEDTADYLLAFYDIEWYAEYHGWKIPKSIIAVLFGCFVGASILALRKPKGGS